MYKCPLDYVALSPATYRPLESPQDDHLLSAGTVLLRRLHSTQGGGRSNPPSRVHHSWLSLTGYTSTTGPGQISFLPSRSPSRAHPPRTHTSKAGLYRTQVSSRAGLLHGHLLRGLALRSLSATCLTSAKLSGGQVLHTANSQVG